MKPPSLFSIVLLFAFITKVTIILALTWIAGGVLHHWSAAQRHRVWAIGIVASLVLPLFAMLTPLRFPHVFADAAVHLIPAATLLRGTTQDATSPAIPNHVQSSGLYGNLTILALLIWAVGVFFATLKLVVGLVQLARMCVRARVVLAAEWESVVRAMAKSLDVQRSVQILECNRGTMPLTWGVFHPRIVLPHDAAEWPQERRRIVLAHELTHIARQDWILQMCAELLGCLYWFHPLVWIATRKLREESERACDDAVLNYGIAASEYAKELLTQTLERSDRNWSTALAISRPSNLERRFTAMLSTSTNRSPLSAKAKLITAVVSICLLLPIVVLQVPAQDYPAKSSTPPNGWILAGSKPANYETGIDPQGRYRGLPSAYLKSKQSAAPEGFGTLMQEFSADQYSGKRVRVSAWVKADQLNDWAGLWMRVDKGSEQVSFDNMMDRPIKGTRGWQNYQVVLDVPQDATGIAFGVLLSKSGTIWLNNVKFDSVGIDVPATGKSRAQGPTNLNFEK